MKTGVNREIEQLIERHWESVMCFLAIGWAEEEKLRIVPNSLRFGRRGDVVILSNRGKGVLARYRLGLTKDRARFICERINEDAKS